MIVLTSEGERTAVLGDDGAFSTLVPTGPVTLLARAPAYSDAVLANVLVPGDAVVEVGVLTLLAGSGRYQAADAGVAVLAGCGDGVVTAAEACDDGNHVSGDGCSATCTLEVQGVGGEWCTDAVRLNLVPVEGGAWGATASGSGTFRSDFTPLSCTLGSELTYRITLPFRGRLATHTDSPLLVSVRPAARCADLELLCGRIDSTTTLPAGDYVIAVGNENGSATFSYTLDVRAIASPTTSVCGDGLVAVDEQCDDGNTTWGDGCGAGCELEVQALSIGCTASTLLQLVPVSATATGASFRTGPAGNLDTSVPLTCYPARSSQTMYRLSLTTRADVTATFGSDVHLTALELNELHDCASLTPLGCTTAKPFNNSTLTVTGLDAGSYLLVVGEETGSVGRGEVIVRKR